MRQSITRHISQILMIVFSVVLGLYLSERIEDYKNEKEATKLMSKIKSELNNNATILEKWVPYHRKIVGTLDSLVNDRIFVKEFINDKTSIYSAFSEQTIMGESPTSDAWDIAKSHPLIVNFDYDELLVLSKVYNQQELTYEPIPKMIDLMQSSEFNKSENADANLRLFKDYLDEVSMRELQLVSYYTDANSILNYRRN